MMQNKDFVVFILSHDRADNVVTLNTLLNKCHYSGDWFIICDNEDDSIDNYYKNFGKDKIIVFDKLAESKTFDTFDLSRDRRTIVYARNACFRVARELGYKYFLELDDDYSAFEFRYPEGKKLKTLIPNNIDAVFDAFLDYYKSINALTLAFAQGGDFLGGLSGSVYNKKILRKAMNSFFCCTDRPFKFIGRINEDVNTYTSLGNKGELLLSITDVMVKQMTTQENKGGMTDVYNTLGTYVKSFYTVICSPSCVKIAMMGNDHTRIHHQVSWENCTPKIISDRFRN